MADSEDYEDWEEYDEDDPEHYHRHSKNITPPERLLVIQSIKNEAHNAAGRPHGDSTNG